MDSSIRRALHMAKDELRSLRQQHQISSAIVDTFHACCHMVAAKVPERAGIGAGEDVVWLIEKLLAEHGERVRPLAGANEANNQQAANDAAANKPYDKRAHAERLLREWAIDQREIARMRAERVEQGNG